MKGALDNPSGVPPEVRARVGQGERPWTHHLWGLLSSPECKALFPPSTATTIWVAYRHLNITHSWMTFYQMPTSELFSHSLEKKMRTNLGTRVKRGWIKRAWIFRWLIWGARWSKHSFGRHNPLTKTKGTKLRQVLPPTNKDLFRCVKGSPRALLQFLLSPRHGAGGTTF